MNGPFYLSPQPSSADTRPRNAFGYLTGFGKAFAAHYQERRPMKTTVKLLSTEMLNTPGLLSWAINGYHFPQDRAQLRRVFTQGFGLTRKCADDLLSGRVPFRVEDGHAVFEYEQGKARKGVR